MLLDKICYWAQYGKATLPGVEGYWVANDRPFWMREAQLSPGQFDRSIAKQAKFELIEKRQYPFAGRNIMHVRPTALTRDIITASKTWDVVAEILPPAGIPIPDCIADHCQVTPPLDQMLEAFDVDKPTPEEIGKLAAYRQNMKAIATPNGEENHTENTLPLNILGQGQLGKDRHEESFEAVARAFL
jgi:hypothetical protein